MISSCSRMNAFSDPSPYNSGMLTLNNPIMQYAISSGLPVCLLDTHFIFAATQIAVHSNCQPSCSIPREQQLPQCTVLTKSLLNALKFSPSPTTFLAKSPV